MTETFGKRLQRLREAKVWTREKLEFECGGVVSLSAIEAIENDRRVPGLYDFKALAEALDVTMDYLYTGVEPSDGEQCEMIPTLDGLTVDETILSCELEILRIEIKSLRRMVRLGKAGKAKREWEGIVSVQIGRVEDHFRGVK